MSLLTSLLSFLFDFFLCSCFGCFLSFFFTVPDAFDELEFDRDKEIEETEEDLSRFEEFVVMFDESDEPEVEVDIEDAEEFDLVLFDRLELELVSKSTSMLLFSSSSSQLLFDDNVLRVLLEELRSEEESLLVCFVFLVGFE